MDFLAKNFRGVLLCFALALPASYLGKMFPVVGAPVFAILFGLLFAFWNRPAFFQPGIQFTAKKVLQYSIILLGFGMNLFEILAVGSQSLLIIISTISTALIVAYVMSKIMNIDRDIATLVGVGSSICGGSAIAAAAPVIKASDKDIAQSISVIFLFNVVAAFLFPALGDMLGFTDTGFGMWAGTAINDTSSVVAAGQTWASAHGSDTALNYATIVKLTRTLAIIPICLGLAYITGKAKNTQTNVKITSIFPMFILYFVLAAVFNTLMGDSIPVLAQLPSIGKFMIAMAMAAIGLNTNLVTLVKSGGKPILLGLICWICIALVSIGMQHVLGIW